MQDTDQTITSYQYGYTNTERSSNFPVSGGWKRTRVCSLRSIQFFLCIL